MLLTNGRIYTLSGVFGGLGELLGPHADEYLSGGRIDAGRRRPRMAQAG
jgi:hypothetical protein